MENRYHIINGVKTFLNPSQQKIWDKSVNEARNRARRENTCRGNYHQCNGDCENCRHSVADEHLFFIDAAVSNDCELVDQAPPIDEALATQDMLRSVYEEADRLVKDGGLLMRLSLEEGLSTSQIQTRTGIAKSTVIDRLSRVLAYVREHREDLLGI